MDLLRVWVVFAADHRMRSIHRDESGARSEAKRLDETKPYCATHYAEPWAVLVNNDVVAVQS